MACRTSWYESEGQLDISGVEAVGGSYNRKSKPELLVEWPEVEVLESQSLDTPPFTSLQVTICRVC